tara:strand:+ start:374 stop:1741 length:1368 start_codon:yes stop_codon:yes gene_type:complete
MKKNVIWWIGVKNPQLNEKYGNYEYFDYSKNTWKHFCERYDCEFVEFSEPVEQDLFKFRVNWQKALFVFDELDKRGIEYDQIALVDSSFMYKWDAPNFFELTDHRFTAWHDKDNMRWIHESIQGYKPFFDGFELDQSRYVNSGFIIFNEKHKEFFQSFKKLYYDNVDTFVELQDKIVNKGTEQTPMNYWLQINDIDVNLELPLAYKLTHMHRRDLLGHNWQIEGDTTPFFIKYGYNWCFNGLPKDQRPQLMGQTWDIVKHNYVINPHDTILNEMLHKDTAKYTTSRKLKKDILEFFGDNYKDKTVVEIGASQGQSTRLLSHVFKKVYAVEWDDWNLEQANKNNKDRDNVEFVKMDLYLNDWKDYLPNNVDVVFIDAGHEYHHVISDIENSLKLWNDVVFIFDDYGLPPGEVKQAIDSKLLSGELRDIKFIGENPDDLVSASGTKFFDMEGCICNA